MQSTIEAAGIRSHLQRCFRRPPRPPWVRVRPTCERRGRGKQQEVSETAALQLDGQEASSEDVSGRKPCLGHPGPQGSCLYRCRQVSVPRPWWSHEVTRGDTGPFTARNRAFNIVRASCASCLMRQMSKERLISYGAFMSTTTLADSPVFSVRYPRTLQASQLMLARETNAQLANASISRLRGAGR